MSLTINLISKNKDDEIVDLEMQIPSPYNDLFGFESCRQSLWGHPFIASLKCELIYSLRNQDLYVFDEQLPKLKNELQQISANIHIVAAKTGYDVEFIRARLENALEAVKVAEKNLGRVGIVVW